MDEAVRTAFDEGLRAWPGTSLTLESFAAHLAGLGLDRETIAARPADLFITAACAAGDELAVRRFEAQYLGAIEAHVARIGLTTEQLGELRQQVRIDLLVGAQPRIGQYRASGPLAAWVRVVVVRTAIHLARRVRVRERTNDVEALDRLIAPDLGPEANVVKERYRERVQDALKSALLALNDREKTLLRLHFIDGLSADGIGRIYNVHRATAARWLVALRQQVLQGVRQELALPGKATSSELRSLMRLVRSEIRLSLQRILQ
jgi:RNA polymerase sigma-70 factor (ECF subfamily)